MEELGLDIKIIFKALFDGFFVKKGKHIGFVKGGQFNLELEFETRDIFVKKNRECYYFVDYGKTWAVSKEELE